ncbi:MAG: DUF881 domain-containing protein [Tissierellia bacterium]|nr:DUF881 domain-containing protein [Tissierellia bacterium]
MKAKMPMMLLFILLFLVFDIGGLEGSEEQSHAREEVLELMDRNKRLKSELNLIKDEIEVYKSSISEEGALSSLLVEESKNFKKLAGYTELKGEGIVILMSDSKWEKGEHQSINEFIIHDEDVYQIVWDLRNAGAEAISINDERILFNYSKILCNGPTIRVNDKLYSQPFIIKAIGPRKALQASINVYGSYADKLKRKGVFIEANTSVTVEIPAYDGLLDRKYLQREMN